MLKSDSYQNLPFFVAMLNGGANHMNANEVAKEVRLAEWARDVKECRSSGMTVKDWCASKGLNINTYRYRYRKLRIAAGERFEVQQECNGSVPAFVPVPAAIQCIDETESTSTSSDTIRFRLDNRTLELPATIPLEYFKTALEVFTDAE